MKAMKYKQINSKKNQWSELNLWENQQNWQTHIAS